MTNEALAWQQVKANAEPVVHGFFPGALPDGLLAVSASAPATGGTLVYRAFQWTHSGRATEFAVSGLELQPDHERLRRVAPDKGNGRTEMEALVRTTIPESSTVVGTLPSSDTSTLFAVRQGHGEALAACAAWWDDDGQLVVLPVNLTVPTSCLLAVSSPEPRAARESTPVASQRQSLEQDRGSEALIDSPRRRGRWLTLALVGVAVVASGWVWRERIRLWLNGPPTTERVLPTTARGIAIESRAASLEVGDTLRLTARVHGGAPGLQPYWSSLDTSIATVESSTGRLTAVRPGAVTVTAQADSLSSEVTVTVVEPAVARLYVTGRDTLSPGATAQFRLRAETRRGGSIAVRSATWTSSNPTVATVHGSTGVVRALRAGSTEIRAASGEASGAITLVVVQTNPPPRPVDAAALITELRALEDESLSTAARSLEDWARMGRDAESLFARLVEDDNRSDAARVILRAYSAAGGRPTACRYFAFLRGSTAPERRLFAEKNRCP